MSIYPLPSHFLCGDSDAGITRSADDGRDMLVGDTLAFLAEYLVAPIEPQLRADSTLAREKPPVPSAPSFFVVTLLVGRAESLMRCPPL